MSDDRQPTEAPLYESGTVFRCNFLNDYYARRLDQDQTQADTYETDGGDEFLGEGQLYRFMEDDCELVDYDALASYYE